MCWALAQKLGWDLKHEMVPEGVGVEVHEMEEGDGSWWKVTRIGSVEATNDGTAVVHEEHAEVRHVDAVVSYGDSELRNFGSEPSVVVSSSEEEEVVS